MKAIPRTLCRTHFGTSCGTVVKQPGKWI